MPRIKLHDLHIDHISSSSGVFSGDNVQIDWRHFSKKSEGNGTVSGDYNHFHNGSHVVVGRRDNESENDAPKT